MLYYTLIIFLGSTIVNVGSIYVCMYLGSFRLMARGERGAVFTQESGPSHWRSKIVINLDNGGKNAHPVREPDQKIVKPHTTVAKKSEIDYLFGQSDTRLSPLASAEI